MVCLTRYLHCINHKSFMSRDSGSKVKKPINVADSAQCKAFEPRMLET